MEWLTLAIAAIVLCFGFVVLFGPPYLPTLGPQARKAMDMINLQPGETLLELGCGDGKVLKLAAEDGLNAVGFELNPILVLVARLRTWSYRKQVKVVWGNFWRNEKWPDADGIFVFMLQKQMQKLDNKIIEWHKGKNKPVRLVSFAFTIPGKEPIEATSTVFLYEYK